MTERKKITLKIGLSPEKIAALEALKKPSLPTPKPAPAFRKPSASAGSFSKKSLPKDKEPISDVGRAVKWLYKTYPALFFKERSKPLKRQIEKDIFNDHDEALPFSKKLIKSALSHYVYSFPYMTGVLIAQGRHDLTGAQVDTLDDDHKKFAIEWLRQRDQEKDKKE